MSPHPTPVGEGQAAPYAYSQPAPTLGMFDQPAPSSGGSRFLLIGCIALLAFCCAIGWGLVLVEVFLTITAPGAPAPTPTPRGFISPADLGLLIQLIG